MKHTPLDAPQLIADFQTVVLALAMKDAAMDEANRSENELMDYLGMVSRGTYLQPATLAQNEQKLITQASVDAHLKKAQAEQVATMSESQVRALVADSKRWVGQKVQIRALDASKQPFRGHYFDKSHGNRLSELRTREVSGVIEEVLMEQNALILRPSVLRKWAQTGLQAYVVTLIDPSNFTPLVVFANSREN